MFLILFVLWLKVLEMSIITAIIFMDLYFLYSYFYFLYILIVINAVILLLLLIMVQIKSIIFIVIRKISAFV